MTDCGIEGKDARQAFKLRSGTVNMDELLVALENVHEGLSEADFVEIERAMNEEYID